MERSEENSKMRRFNWPVHVYAETTDMQGKKRKMHRVVEGMDGADRAIELALESRRDAWIFSGCEITVITPMGQRVKRIVNPDTGKPEAP